MDRFSRNELRQLLEEAQSPCVSIYMPTDRTGRDTRESPIRCKNLVAQAETRLCETGLRRPEAHSLLKPVEELLGNAYFWTHQSDGLALFVDKTHFHRFRVPLEFDELVAANERFYLSPLLPLLQGDGRFFVLAVSLKSIQFFQGTRRGLSPMAPEGLPNEFIESLRLWSLTDEPDVVRFGKAGIRAQGSHQGFGHDQEGAGQEYKKGEAIVPYFRDLNDGLDKFFTTESAPLVFAGVDYLFPLFQQTCGYRYLVDRSVTGNPEGWNEQQLHREAWNIVEPLFQQGRRDALEQYGNKAAHHMASGDLAEVITAAHEGRVDTLFVAQGKQCWGVVDSNTGVVVHADNWQGGPGRQELVEHATTHALLQGAKVYAIAEEELPAGEFAAAIFRFTNPGRAVAAAGGNAMPNQIPAR